MKTEIYKIEWSIIWDGEVIVEKKSIHFKDRQRRDAEEVVLREAAMKIGLHGNLLIESSTIYVHD